MAQRDIQIFLTLAEELHFGRAATRQCVTTARVSQVIRQMERRVGAALFERTSRRVELTPIGRRLERELRPAYQQIQDGIDRAVRTARGISGELRVGFVGAAPSQLVLEVAAVFQARHPDCEVTIRESPIGAGLDLLRAGAFEMMLAVLPATAARATDLTRGAVLRQEGRMVAVPLDHDFAGRESVSFADLADARVLRSPPALPDHWDRTLAPRRTRDGRPAERGPTFATVQEMLALVGAGKGTFPVPAHASRYYQRPDVTYVPIDDAPPVEWRFIWPTAAATGLVLAFDRTATELVNTR